ncbi:MAG: hypothetical protein MK106_07260 [Mariniblastus sp.]|nr:hypothetical protein [Mariniblastus sp.]
MCMLNGGDVPTPGQNTTEPAFDKPSVRGPTLFEKVFCIEWLGQTAASLCWIASVFAYGIEEKADWLQLAAASSWLLANIAAAITIKADTDAPSK